MKVKIGQGVFSLAVAALTAYFNALIIPIIVLIIAMVIDYTTGMTKAWFTSTISSKIGLKGIIKKLCYLILVCVGMGVDWVIGSGLHKAGFQIETVFVFGLIVIIWLIINELISICENLSVIGVPIFKPLLKLIKRLKITVENAIDANDTDSEENNIETEE